MVEFEDGGCLIGTDIAAQRGQRLDNMLSDQLIFITILVVIQ